MILFSGTENSKTENVPKIMPVKWLASKKRNGTIYAATMSVARMYQNTLRRNPNYG
jgi:hypothetical protein